MPLAISVNKTQRLERNGLPLVSREAAVPLSTIDGEAAIDHDSEPGGRCCSYLEVPCSVPISAPTNSTWRVNGVLPRVPKAQVGHI